MSISIGKLRGLQQVANESGFLTICAIDHRGALQRALNEKNPDAVTYQDMVNFKLDLCQAVSPFVSAVLLDPVYGAAQAITSGILPGHIGLLVGIEKTGYSGDKAARITELQPDWGVEKIKKMGASAVKMLVYFRPDSKETASRQLEIVARVADECLKEDILLLVEPVSYPISEIGEKASRFAAMKPELVIETARQITALPIDVLKAEFPADMEFEKDEKKLLRYCQELDQASRLPWVLLSAGADFETFQKQVELAAKAGASGFLAGRALWQEAVKLYSREARQDFFRTTTVARLKELAGLVTAYGKPWHKKMGSRLGSLDRLSDDWYRRY
ncbi:MAG: tagatose 1,6-diphosphate aldolase [Chloroflexi bacterium]|nr:tagatose 1,6-diphosphate aldolase [Chloroflexota bacterium]